MYIGSCRATENNVTSCFKLFQPLPSIHVAASLCMARRSDYDEKMRGMLDDTTTYKKLKKDPTATQETRIVRTLLRLHNNGELTKCIYNRIRPTGSSPPRIYGLPKIHKPHIPLRPIVSCIGAPSYKLSKYIASVISPLAGKTSSHVLNSKHFVGMMKDVHVKAEEALVSFDVTSLFTNVPINEAVDVIHRKLTEEEEEDLVERTPLPAERITELLQLCLSQPTSATTVNSMSRGRAQPWAPPSVQ